MSTSHSKTNIAAMNLTKWIQEHEFVVEEKSAFLGLENNQTALYLCITTAPLVKPSIDLATHDALRIAARRLEELITPNIQVVFSAATEADFDDLAAEMATLLGSTAAYIESNRKLTEAVKNSPFHAHEGPTR